MLHVVLKYVQFTLAGLITLLFTSCMNSEKSINLIPGYTKIEGNNIPSTQNRQIEGQFEKINSSATINVEITQGDNYSIRVEADENIIDFIETKVSNNTLHIGYASGTSISNADNSIVYVTLPNIEGLSASSSSSIIATTTIKADQIEIAANSTAEIKLEHLKAKSVSIKASSSGEIEINQLVALSLELNSMATGSIEIENLEAESVSANANSSGSIEVSGMALSLKAKANSTAEIEAKNLKVNDITAEASSSGSIEVFPLKSLNASASSAATIEYYNKPKEITVNTSSAGSIKHK